MKNKKEIITEEGFELKFYPREKKMVSLNISADTFELLEKKANERDLPLKALLKFYIGQGLRNDLSDAEARELTLTRLRSRKLASAVDEVDLAA
ncbi:hypothetical protein BH10ACI2_BH10ACI2_12870 [soil metagenome]